MSTTERNNTDSLPSSRTTNLKTISKEGKNFETPLDPLEPHDIEKEAFKAAYKAGNTDYNNHVEIKCRERRSIKTKIKKAFGKVNNEPKNNNEENPVYPSDEVDELVEKMRHSQSGNHLEIVEDASSNKKSNLTGRKNRSHDSLSKEKVHNKVEYPESSKTGSDTTVSLKSSDSKAVKDNNNNKLEHKRICSTDSKKSIDDNFSEKSKSHSTKSQSIIPAERKTKLSESCEAKNNASYPNSNIDTQKANNNHGIDSIYPNRESENLENTSSLHETSSSPDVYSHHLSNKKFQNNTPVAENHSGTTNNTAEKIFSAGTAIYKTLFRTNSESTSDYSNTLTKPLSKNYNLLGDIIEGPSGTTYCKKLPKDITLTKKSSFENIRFISQGDERTPISTKNFGTPHNSNKSFEYKTDKKFKIDSSVDQLLRTNTVFESQYNKLVQKTPSARAGELDDETISKESTEKPLEQNKLISQNVVQPHASATLKVQTEPSKSVDTTMLSSDNKYSKCLHSFKKVTIFI